MKHPFVQQLEERAEELQKRRKKEIVSCEECGTEVLKDDVEDAVETAERHDEKRHGGAPTAKVNGITPPQFSEEEKEEIKEAVETLKEIEEETND